MSKALQKIGILIFLFIAAPLLLTMAFKAIKIYTEGMGYWVAHLFLILAVLLVLFTFFFAFKTIGAISKVLFKK